ncbi:MAG: hypothetical protein V7K57_26925, partial [Nostoc sp.]|uniref:hypothetical protein n=1 Tax=Nostoc sp. TaxID=1180 RepID=UPI002FF4E05C
HRSKVSFHMHLDVNILHHPILYCTQAGTAIVYTNVTMMDEYLPGITFVIDGDASPKEAITKIETTI